MAAQLRSVNTKFWDDPWIETLSVSEKLLFLYLITNSYGNLTGIYEITIKRICFETGIDNKTVSNGLERFAKDKKAYFVDGNFIVLPNWLKNQNLNANMKKGVEKIIQQLPNHVKISVLGNDYLTIQKDYQSIRNTLLKYEVEIEDEIEYEDECEINQKEIISQKDIDDVYDSYPSKCIISNRSTGKSHKQKDKIKAVLKSGDYTKESLIEVINIYVKDCKLTKTFIKNFPTFLNNIPDYDKNHVFNDKQVVTSQYKKPDIFQGYD